MDIPQGLRYESNLVPVPMQTPDYLASPLLGVTYGDYNRQPMCLSLLVREGWREGDLICSVAEQFVFENFPFREVRGVVRKSHLTQRGVIVFNWKKWFDPSTINDTVLCCYNV